MKKFFLLAGLLFSGITVFSQDLSFTKGGVAPGKFQSGKDYEDFLVGKVKVVDASGVAYSFVKAEFVLVSKEGKQLRLTLTQNDFSEAERLEIIKADNEGTVYTFSGIVVRDSKGKEFTLAKVQYEYLSHNR